MLGQRATANLVQGRTLRVGGETAAEVAVRTEKERDAASGAHCRRSSTVVGTWGHRCVGVPPVVLPWGNPYLNTTNFLPESENRHRPPLGAGKDFSM
jgi:hypothetical protein